MRICCQTWRIASEVRISDQLSRKYLTCTYYRSGINQWQHFTDVLSELLRMRLRRWKKLRMERYRRSEIWWCTANVSVKGDKSGKIEFTHREWAGLQLREVKLWKIYQHLSIASFRNLLSASRYTAFAEQGVGLPGLFICHSWIQSLLDLGPVTVITGSRAWGARGLMFWLSMGKPGGVELGCEGWAGAMNDEDSGAKTTLSV